MHWTDLCLFNVQDDDDDQEADMQDHNVQAMFGHVTISNQGGASCSSREEAGDRTGENDTGKCNIYARLAREIAPVT